MPTTPPARAFQRLSETAEKLDTSPADYFLSAGLDYKGQVQSGYTMKGHGVAATIGFDPFPAFLKQLEWLKVGIEGGLSTKRINETLLVVQRGPAAIKGGPKLVSVDLPIILNCLTGVHWESSADAGASAGFTAEFDLWEWWNKVTPAPGDGGKQVEGQPAEGGPLTLEAVALKTSVKAGAKAGLKYTYANLYVEDPAPLWFEPIQESATELREMLEAILSTGTLQAKLMKDAAALISRNTAVFGGPGFIASWTPGWLAGWTGAPTPESVVATLEKGLAKLEEKAASNYLTRAEKRVRAETRNLVGGLGVWAGLATPSGESFLRLSSHNPSGSAAISGATKFEGGLAIAGSGSMEAEGTLGGCEGSEKWATMRYQMAVATTPVVLCTQDTALRYSTWKFEALKGTVKAQGTVKTLRTLGNKTFESKALGTTAAKLDEGITAWNKALNRLSYRSAITVWTRPDDLPAPRSGESPDKTVTKNVPVRAGCGLAFGESCVVATLRDLELSHDPLSDDPDEAWFKPHLASYAKILAQRLNVKVPVLMSFLHNEQVREIIGSLYSQGESHQRAFTTVGRNRKQRQQDRQRITAGQARFDEQYQQGEDSVEKWRNTAVLIEASFAVSAGMTVPVQVERSAVWDDEFDDDPSLVNTVRLGPDLLKTYSQLRSVQTGSALQAMRLRFRIQDADSNDSSGFNLGFKLFGQGGGVSLQTVDRAGSEGIVDLATVWMDPRIEALSRKDPAGVYEDAVPPVVLFCQ